MQGHPSECTALRMQDSLGCVCRYGRASKGSMYWLRSWQLKCDGLYQVGSILIGSICRSWMPSMKAFGNSRVWLERRYVLQIGASQLIPGSLGATHHAISVQPLLSPSFDVFCSMKSTFIPALDNCVLFFKGRQERQEPCVGIPEQRISACAQAAASEGWLVPGACHIASQQEQELFKHDAPAIHSCFQQNI